MITITNDTTTLNGALVELGETMAANLVTMGVTDATASDGLTTLAGNILLVPQGSVTKTLTLTSDKSILSYYDSESATLTATVVDENSVPVEGETVEFFKGSTSLGTSVSDSSGLAVKSYGSTGAGDFSFTAVIGQVTSNSVSIEDCYYYAPTETSVTRSGTSIYDYWNNGRFSNLPSTYTVEFDMKTSTAPVNNGEHRIYWCPTSQWTGTSTQPRNAVFVGYAYQSGMKFNFGKRLNGTTSAITNPSTTTNNWDSIKIAKVNSSGRCDFYLNGTYRDYYTLDGMDNYSEFAITYFIWSDTTFSVKNIKIKAL